jgi:hypothetical protein
MSKNDVMRSVRGMGSVAAIAMSMKKKPGA